MIVKIYSIIVICGPTATGKTALAARLAKELNGELVSADSRQVFRGRDLETNKERPDVPIWLYDVAEWGDDFSVAHWVKLARAAIADIRSRGKVPIVVGGSGLYIKALLSPFATIDVPPNKALRNHGYTVSELQKMTVRGDMNESDWQNPRRLIRKIEIARAGKQEAAEKPPDALVIGLTAPLSVLYERIDKHLEERKIAGMKEAFANEHAIARKQVTWFKKQKDIHWFDVRSPSLYTDVLYLVRNVSQD